MNEYNFLLRWMYYTQDEKVDVSLGGLNFFTQQQAIVETAPVHSIEVEKTPEGSLIQATEKPRGTYAESEDIGVTQAGGSRIVQYKYNLYELKSIIAASTLARRIPGVEAVNSSPDATSTQVRANIIATKLLYQQFVQHLTTTEKLAWEVLLTGKLKTLQGTIDYERKTSLLGKTATKAWSADDADILTDLGKANKALSQAGAASGTLVAVLGETAANNFLEKMSAMGDHLNIRISDISIYNVSPPSEVSFMVSNGFDYLGTVIAKYSSEKVHIFTYPRYYQATKTATVSTPFLDDNTALIMRLNKSFARMAYGYHELMMENYKWFEREFFGGIKGAAGKGTIASSPVPSNALHVSFYPIGNSACQITSQFSPLPILEKNNNVIALDTSKADRPL